jgi:predicted N-acetyltransferase YhbS
MNAAEIVQRLTRNPRAWFSLDGRGELYLRFNCRLIDGSARKVIDFANVEVRELYRQQGIFSASLKAVEEAARLTGRDVFAELVTNMVVRDALARRGYTVMPSASGVTCDAYKVTT